MFASRIRLSIDKGFGAGSRVLGYGKAVQDMPPPGGYPKILTERTLPDRGPSGAVLWGGSALMIMWGFYQVGQENARRSSDKLESREARLAIIPVLQAEEDVKCVKAEIADLKDEAVVMKGVKGWKVGESVYHSGKWMPPTTAI